MECSIYDFGDPESHDTLMLQMDGPGTIMQLMEDQMPEDFQVLSDVCSRGSDNAGFAAIVAHHGITGCP